MTVVVDASVLVAALVDSENEGSWSEAVIAEGFDCPLITLDRKLNRAGGVT